jgi:hypothetical protein
MSRDLASLTAEDFGELVGDTFSLSGEDGTALEAVLSSVQRATHGRPEARTPFSVVFRGPVEPVLPQHIYRFGHSALGTLELFVVPVGRDERGVYYEAVFS